MVQCCGVALRVSRCDAALTLVLPTQATAECSMRSAERERELIMMSLPLSLRLSSSPVSRPIVPLPPFFVLAHIKSFFWAS